MPVGSLVTRVANYTTSMSDLFTNVVVSLLRNALTIIGVYVIMFFLSWKLSLMLLGFVAVVFIASFIFRKIITKIWRQERQYTSDLNTFLNENLSGMKIIQIFNQEKRKEGEFNEKNTLLRKTKFKAVLAFASYRPFISFLYFAALAVTFFAGVRLELTAGEIVAFYLYLSRFFNPVQNIADQLNQIQKATTSSERLFNLLDVQPESLDKPNPIHVDHFVGKIEFRNVWFAYENEDWILKNVSSIPTSAWLAEPARVNARPAPSTKATSTASTRTSASTAAPAPASARPRPSLPASNSRNENEKRTTR